MSDIVERLRQRIPECGLDYSDFKPSLLLTECADTIEQQAAELNRNQDLMQEWKDEVVRYAQLTKQQAAEMENRKFSLVRRGALIDELIQERAQQATEIERLNVEVRELECELRLAKAREMKLAAEIADLKAVAAYNEGEIGSGKAEICALRADLDKRDAELERLTAENQKRTPPQIAPGRG